MRRRILLRLTPLPVTRLRLRRHLRTMLRLRMMTLLHNSPPPRSIIDADTNVCYPPPMRAQATTVSSQTPVCHEERPGIVLAHHFSLALRRLPNHPDSTAPTTKTGAAHANSKQKPKAPTPDASPHSSPNSNNSPPTDTPHPSPTEAEQPTYSNDTNRQAEPAADGFKPRHSHQGHLTYSPTAPEKRDTSAQRSPK